MLKKPSSIPPEKHGRDFFHIVIVGRSGCGKTVLLQKLLMTEFFNRFNAIFLICPTYINNQSYTRFYTDDKFYILPGPVDELESSIRHARNEAKKYFQSLIIFDDVVGDRVMNSRTSEYVKLLVNGRQDGISTITLAQQLTSVSKVARDQMTRILTFYNPDGDDRKIMFGKFLCDVEPDELKKAIHHLRTTDFAYMDINILKGNYKLC